MLIDSPRLKHGDREHWSRLERYDQAIGTRLDRKEEQAITRITQWAAAGDGVCSVSWGKDSTVVAHLLALSGVRAPIVWVRSDPFEMPECDDVKDAFLATHTVEYVEKRAILRNPKRGEEGYETHHTNPNKKHQDVLKENIRGRYISGVRAQESRMRQRSARWHGTVSKNTCRPILDWTAEEVFAYMYRENLPVHPAYAMTYAGKLDRRWLRVHPLCSYHEESSVHGRDMVSWEDDYYADAIHAAIQHRLINR
ncbi:phosphoadenosine phosphosulfate reductase family protein [Corynebacterium liangguodongii]|uniref:Uncharacterized protein n=1 Tax=Corynebacterium liangguodongii TaxID=2079535 RepID=A0A2S0WGJ3_9CORY|nr:phosphoadenosine phosphosulfate reductase family protein [Corynebacterium liangguodongii]AWB84792.1 hypothetical protein C3E79_10165 [Corynebacterium liangguodongii]PWB99150.1 hypothetical protein DF219_07780 [Corynebacterium liangguodongii]